MQVKWSNKYTCSLMYSLAKSSLYRCYPVHESLNVITIPYTMPLHTHSSYILFVYYQPQPHIIVYSVLLRKLQIEI